MHSIASARRHGRGRPRIAGAEDWREVDEQSAATGVGRHIAPGPARPRSRRPDVAGTQRVGLSRQKLRAAFADMHRELYDLWTVGETVIVRLALQGTPYWPPPRPAGQGGRFWAGTP